MSIALIVCIIGGIFYLLGAFKREAVINDHLQEMFRLAFFAGLLAYLLKG